MTSAEDGAPALGETTLLRGVGHDAAWTYLPSLIGLVSSVVITTYVSRTLGVRELGLYAVPLVVVGLLQTVDFALSTTVQRAAAAAGEAAVLGVDHEDERRSAQGAQRLYGASGLLAAVVLGVLALVIDRVTTVPPDLVGDARWSCALLGLVALATLSTSAAMGALMGERHFRTVALTIVVGQVLTLGLLFVLVRPLGLPGLALAQLAGVLLTRGLALVACHRRVGWLDLRPALPSRADVREVRQLSGPVFVLSAAMQVMTASDLLVVAAEAGPLAAGQFRIGYVVATQASGLVFQGYDAVLPTLAGSSRRTDAQEHAVRVLTRIWAFLGGLGFAVLAAGGPGVIQVLSGQHHRDGVLTLVLLCGAWSINLCIHGFSLLLVARGDARSLVRVVLTEVVANLALTVVLVEAVGGWGSALATLLLAALSNLVWLPARLRGLMDRPLHHLVVVDGLVPLALGALPVLLVWLASMPLALSAVGRLLVLLAAVPVGLAAWLAVAPAADREELRGALTRRSSPPRVAE